MSRLLMLGYIVVYVNPEIRERQVCILYTKFKRPISIWNKLLQVRERLS